MDFVGEKRTAINLRHFVDFHLPWPSYFIIHDAEHYSTAT